AGEEPVRILAEADCERLLERAHALARGGGDTAVTVSSWWHGELRWARNRVTSSADRREHLVTVIRTAPTGHRGAAQTNQLDDVSLEGAVRSAERVSTLGRAAGRGLGYFPPLPAYERPAA